MHNSQQACSFLDKVNVREKTTLLDADSSTTKDFSQEIALTTITKLEQSSKGVRIRLLRIPTYLSYLDEVVKANKIAEKETLAQMNVVQCRQLTRVCHPSPVTVRECRSIIPFYHIESCSRCRPYPFDHCSLLNGEQEGMFVCS